MRTRLRKIVILLPLYWCAWLHAQVPANDTLSTIVNLQAGEIRLLEIDQQGADLLVSVADGSRQMVVNHPLGHTGPELVLVGPYPAAMALTVQATAIDGAIPEAFPIQVHRLSANDPAVPVYRELTEAGRLFQIGSAEALASALRLYAGANAGALPPQWRNYPQYLAAKVEFFLFDLEAAKARLLALPQTACTMPFYCYKAELLLQEILFAQDEFRPVIASLTRIREQLESTERSPNYLADLCQLLVNLGISEVITGNNERSMPALETALSLARQLRSKQLMGEALNGLATWHVQPANRNLTLVADYLQQASDYLRDAKDDRSYVSVANNLGITYSLLGEMQLAQKTYLQAMPIAVRSQDESLRSAMYKGLASVYKTAGDWNPAEHYYRMNLELDSKTGRNGRQYGLMNNLGSVLREKGDVEGALALHKQALEYFRGNGPQVALVNILQEQAFDQLALGHSEEAGRLFESVAQEGESGQRLYNATENVMGRARVAMAMGKLSLALQLTNAQWQEAGKTDGNLPDKMQLATLLMQIQRQRGDLVAATGYGKRMVKLSHDIRGQLEHIRLGAAWSAHMHDGYKEFAEVLIDRYHKEGKVGLLQQALSVLENSRAQNLLLQRHLASTLRNGESSERRNLRRRLTEISNRRAALMVGTPDYEAISLEYFQLLEDFQSHYLRQDGEGEGTAVFEPVHARTRLGSNKVLAEYLCIKDRNCHVLVMNNKELKVFDAGSFAEVAKLAKDLNLSLRSPGADSAATRQRLGALLLGDAINDPIFTGRNELLIVADFPLNNLPFAALTTAGEEALVQHYAISMIPSLSYWKAEPRRSREHKLDVAVFADPVFSGEALQKTDGSSNNFSGWLQSLDRLRWSGQEASNLAALFAGGNVKIYSREAATRANLLKAETRSARILHIASHAYFNESMQDLVGIALSSADPAQKSGDFLTLQELFDSSFQAELVVISGCDTGVGEYQPGEGNLSMARGFIAQGADQVISTLWPVSDRASVEFVRLFYAALAEDQRDVSRALRLAQQGLAANKDYGDAFYWASYVLTSIN